MVLECDEDAYGNLLNIEASEAATSLLYSGEFTDVATGQQYLRARFYDPSNGRFNRLDPFAGRANDPQSLHKYAYVHGDPISNIDPTGQFSAVGLSVSIGVGAFLGATAQITANYALGNPLLSGVGYGALFGGVALPLSILSPGLGVGIAAFGIAGASAVNYSVFTNPNATLGQKGAAATLLVASTFGGRAAYKNFKVHGWTNSQGLAQVGKSLLLNRDSPLSRWLKGTPDDAYIHISPETPATLKGGVHESSGRPGWVRFGDVKHLSPAQYRAEIVGPLAAGNSGKATTFAIRMPSARNQAIFRSVGPDIVNSLGVNEYETSAAVIADAFMLVPQGSP